MLSRQRLHSVLDHFPRLTIGLLGDLFLDRYLELEPGIVEMSIETGLEAYQVATVRNSPGAMGTVMNNLAALGIGCLVPVTVIGDDGHGYDLLRQLTRLPADRDHIVQAADRLTPTYTKPMRLDAQGHWCELNRLDVRTRRPLSAAALQQLGDHLRRAFARCDGLIVLDQINETDCGVVHAQTRELLRHLHSKSPDKLIFVDSRAHLGQFDFGVLKGNRSEVLRAATSDGESLPIEAAAQRLAARTKHPVYATLGEAGILVAQADGSLVQAAGITVPPPIDIVGAGDSASSGIVASLLSGASHAEAAAIGNLVASVTVRQLGTTGTAAPPDVVSAWEQSYGG